MEISVISLKDSSSIIKQMRGMPITLHLYYELIQPAFKVYNSLIYSRSVHYLPSKRKINNSN